MEANQTPPIITKIGLNIPIQNKRIVHGMRDDVLIGVEDIGLRIERSN
jgi:hypothetical protein